MNRQFLLIGLALVFAAASAHAVYVQVSAVGGPFVTDSNILVMVKVFDNNGDAKNNVDLNTYFVNKAGTASDINYHGSVQGLAFRTVKLSSAGDYNIVAKDLNDSITGTVTIKVGAVKSITATYGSHNPPFDATKNDDINFTLQAKTAASNDVNATLTVRLVSDANNSQAAPSFSVDANAASTYAFDTNGLAQGLYYLDVNSGLALIPVPVFKYQGFADIKDDQNNATTAFGAGKTVFITVRATNFDGNVSQTISGLTVSVRDPEGDTNSSIPCVIPSQAICRFVVPSDSNSGEYTLTATMSVGSDQLVVRRSFSVLSYQMSFFAQKFSGGDAAIEKMPSVYPTGASAAFEAHFVDTSTGSEITGTALQGRFCQDANILVYIQKSGDRDKNAIADTTTWSSGTPNYCVVTITTPSTQGNYIVTAEARFGTQKLTKSAMLVVQNFMIFLQPVAADTFDPSTPSGKFNFFRGERVGFNPSYADLNGSLSPKIVRVRSIQVAESGGLKTFTGSDINWHTDKNILSLSVAALNQLSGGFKPVTAVVDVNKIGEQDSNSITALGMFKLSVLSLSASLVDSNNALTSSAKTQSFGPMSVAPDENIYVKVTATSGSGGSGISGATASLKSLQNVETWQSVSASRILSKVTDSNGVAILDIGKLASLGLTSGGYFGQVEVVTNDGNVDTTEFFFESRSFVAFMQPSDANCNFVQNFRKDENATFIIRAFNPRQGFGTGDINLTVASSGALTLHYFGSPSKPQFPPNQIASVNYDVNANYRCPAMGFGSPGQTSRAARVTIRKESDGNWTTGFYSPALAVTADGGDLNGVRETGRGFMRVQSFTLLANPGSTGQFGPPVGKPGAPFDLNVTVLGADGNVNLTAKLVDMAGGGHFEFEGGGSSGTGSGKDLNIGLNRAGKVFDCNSTRCHAKDVNITNSISPRVQDANNVRVLIPSTAKLQEYLVTLTATDRSGNTAEGEIFLTTKLFKLVNFGWYGSMFGIYGLSTVAPADWNTAGISAQEAYTYNPGFTPGGNAPNIDFNFAVNYTNRRISLDTNSYLLTNRTASNYDKNFSADANKLIVPGDDINGTYRITDMSRVGGTEAGIKFIRKSALDTTESSFGYIGAYPADANFTVPIMVKDVNGSGIDANVSITNIGIFNAGSFFPAMMGARSCSTLTELRACSISNDFNSVYDQTDANGFALLNLKVSKPGSRLMLEITVWNTSSAGTVLSTTQKLQPFDGPMLDVKKYTVSTLITGPVFTVDYNIASGSDINAGPNTTGLTGLTADVNYGKISPRDTNNSILGDINEGSTFYFTKVWGTTGPAILIDDDTNFGRNAGPPYYDGNVLEAGDFSETVCYDLNSECILLRQDGSNVGLYFDGNRVVSGTGGDTNIFDNNTVFYPVYNNPWGMFGTTAPSYDANIQIAVSLTDLSGNALTDTYTISGVRLENYAQYSTSSITCSACSNRTGTTLINLGNFAGRAFPANYNVVFTLTVGSSITEERASFEVRRPT